ncbi:putative hydro-lyase [Nocardioides aquiterrae]|uniref:Putative hydro-lyase GCM10009606_01520 n=1 Tax=Nocardioides aquiterrae TaxID=203799 RepID=A0ABN1U8B5_9ACTN
MTSAVPGTTHDDIAALTPARARERFRAGERVATSGWCAGFTQANLIAVPQQYAYDVLLFTQRNPKACPVIDVTDAGSVEPGIAPGADLRTDLPGYRVYEEGRLVAETGDAREHWRDDMVTFLIGCSFTFERALLESGVPVRHLTAGTNVPMYRTNRACRPAGRLHGPMVVSMRAVPADQVAAAVQVTSRFPSMHGGPVHVGDPAALGIADLARPDYGDAPVLADGDVPVFWACGVTPQAVVAAAGIPYAVSHAPGQMFISDVPEATWALA